MKITMEENPNDPIRQIQSACGLPDKGDAIQTILAICKDACKEEVTCLKCGGELMVNYTLGSGDGYLVPCKCQTKEEVDPSDLFRKIEKISKAIPDEEWEKVKCSECGGAEIIKHIEINEEGNEITDIWKEPCPKCTTKGVNS